MSVRRGVGSVDADIEMTRSPGQRCKKIIGERAPAQTGLLPLFAVLPSRNIYYGPHLHKTAIYACLRALSLGELGRPSHAGQVASGAPLDPNAPIWPRHERWWTIESKTAYNGINVRWSNGVRVGRAALIGGWSKLLGREVVCNTQSKEGGKKGQKGDDKGVTGRHSTADGLGLGRPLLLCSAVALRLANDEELAVWADDNTRQGQVIRPLAPEHFVLYGILVLISSSNRPVHPTHNGIVSRSIRALLGVRSSQKWWWWLSAFSNSTWVDTRWGQPKKQPVRINGAKTSDLQETGSGKWLLGGPSTPKTSPKFQPVAREERWPAPLIPVPTSSKLLAFEKILIPRPFLMKPLKGSGRAQCGNTRNEYLNFIFPVRAFHMRRKDISGLLNPGRWNKIQNLTSWLQALRSPVLGVALKPEATLNGRLSPNGAPHD
uniref:Uncharacterized protein n=1 Tax=Coccidioides posadasii RMSCC 3488 TaxID=454284 RepID=A0A0J6FVY8_COCPO|nr:hypothetical protein CPAG_09648 [Coccidioides posadasii RMSCC 3488]